MIEILLATYNGEKYLEEQIESLENQTYENIRIIIRDDGSTDNTVNIIKKMMKKYNNIKFIVDNKKIGSPQNNFFEILKYANAEYVMFCDQDDVWLENKVAISYNAIKNYDNIIAMASSDCIITDNNLNYIRKKGLQTDNKITDFSQLLVDNCFMGCTMILNKKLYSIINEIPEECLMHDIWIALIASSMGKIIIIPEKCMLYRQHDKNCVGSKNIYNLTYTFNKLFDSQTKNNLKKLVKQAMAFKREYYDYLTDYNKKVLDTFVNIYKTNRFKRVYNILKFNLRKRGKIRFIGELLYFFIDSGDI